jgi:soluble lytic murein transglycosylase-like protein
MGPPIGGEFERRIEERRHGDRRGTERGGADRRCNVRRYAPLRNLILTAMTLAAAPGLNDSRLALRVAPAAPKVLEARVLSSIDAVNLVMPPARAYDRLIHEAGELYRVSPTLIRAVMQAESAFDPLAVSPAGAMGLMQLMPEIAGAFDIADPFDPRENIMGGARLLRELLDAHPHNIPLVLAAYNAGPTAVARYGGVPPFRETQGYVKKIIGLIEDARNEGSD